MTSASNFPQGLGRFLTTPDVVALLQLHGALASQRQVEDMLRDPDAPQVPVFGTVGRSRLYDEGVVRTMLPELLQWLADAPRRALERRAATIAAENERREFVRATTWADPVADARRARAVPDGFMAGDPPPRPKARSNIGRPKGGA